MLGFYAFGVNYDTRWSPRHSISYCMTGTYHTAADRLPMRALGFSFLCEVFVTRFSTVSRLTHSMHRVVTRAHW
jgi:hypothetical protein